MPIGNLFNEEWYLNNNPDVRAAVDAGLVDARTHFELHGRFEGRSPAVFVNNDVRFLHAARLSL